MNWRVVIQPPATQHQTARFLLPTSQVVAQLDSGLSEPQAFHLVPQLLAASSLQSLTELSWQRQAFVPASLTGFLFALQFWHFADAFYFHVKSVINIFFNILFNTTLDCFFYFFSIWFFKAGVTEGIQTALLSERKQKLKFALLCPNISRNYNRLQSIQNYRMPCSLHCTVL